MYENRLRFIASWETLLGNINGAISFRVLSSVRMLFILFTDDYFWTDNECEAGTAAWLYHQDAQWRLVRCTIHTISIAVFKNPAKEGKLPRIQYRIQAVQQAAIKTYIHTVER
jgi:hypothetical protein